MRERDEKEETRSERDLVRGKLVVVDSSAQRVSAADWKQCIH